MKIKAIDKTEAIEKMFMNKWIRNREFGVPFDRDEVLAIEEEMAIYVEKYFLKLGDDSEVFDAMLGAYLDEVDFGKLAETYWDETPA